MTQSHSDTPTDDAVERAKAETKWAIKRWANVMSPEQLMQAIFDAPALRAALAAAKADRAAVPVSKLIEFQERDCPEDTHWECLVCNETWDVQAPARHLMWCPLRALAQEQGGEG